MSRPTVSLTARDTSSHPPLGTYMGITVFRNGSLARERVRDEFRMNWSEFSEALDTTPPGNEGAMMLPWFEPEITPNVPTPAQSISALNGHPRPDMRERLSKHKPWRSRAIRNGWKLPLAGFTPPEERLRTAILQVFADVFDAEVYRFDSTDSAALPGRSARLSSAYPTALARGRRRLRRAAPNAGVTCSCARRRTPTSADLRRARSRGLASS